MEYSSEHILFSGCVGASLCVTAAAIVVVKYYYYSAGISVCVLRALNVMCYAVYFCNAGIVGSSP